MVGVLLGSHVPPKPLMGDVWFGVSKVCCMPSFTSAQINTSLACQPCSWSWGGSQGFMTGTLVAAATVATVLPLMNIFFADIFFRFIFISFHIQWWYQRRNQDGIGGIMWYQPSADQLTQKLPREPCRWTFAWKPSLGCSLLACRTAWVGDLCWWCATGRRFRKESWSSEFNLGGNECHALTKKELKKTKTIKPLDITSHCISKLSGGLIT